MIEFLSKESIAPFMSKIFVLLFQRLSSSKTVKYVKSLLVFFSLFAIRYGASELITTTDAVQAKLFGMVIERLILPEVQKVSGSLDRKMCAVGITRLLCDAPECLSGEFFFLIISFFFIDLIFSILPNSSKIFRRLQSIMGTTISCFNWPFRTTGGRIRS